MTGSSSALGTRAGVLLVPAALALACEPTPPPAPTPEEHAAAVEEWRADRYEKLRLPDGWLSLVGLFWLQEGESTFGADPGNTFTYAGSGPLEAYPGGGVPGRLGTFTLRDSTVVFEAAPGVQVAAGGSPVERVVMRPSEEPVTLEWGPVQWLALRRGDRYAIRVRDAASPVRTGFEGIESFPVEMAWRFPARFEWHDPPRTLLVPNILGDATETPSPATVVFEFAGRKHRLDLWKDSDDLANFFTAFGDGTNGGASYGGGRFLWIDAPGEDGWTVVDFNRSYNPPCVFTEFATCPLPPRQNRLTFDVTAGEKVFGKR